MIVAALFYCGTPWAFHMIVLNVFKIDVAVCDLVHNVETTDSIWIFFLKCKFVMSGKLQISKVY